jgi:hypothetical protein
MLKLTTTARAHTLLLEWLSCDTELESLYHNFALYFDSRIDSSEARKILANYRIPKSSSLHEAQAYIMELVQRATEDIPKGTSRTMLYNLECVQALIRALPSTSSVLATNTYSSLTARMERPATASELSRALNLYRASIDQDIKQNGAPIQKGEAQGVEKKRFFKFTRGPKAPNKTHKHSQNAAVNSLSTNEQHASATIATLQSGQQDTRSNSGRGRGATRGNRGGRQNVSRPVGQGTTMKYCSLCGLKGHTASEACRNMRNDKGEIIELLPIQDTCKLCPEQINPRLHHPPNFCPYRANGPWHNRK